MTPGLSPKTRITLSLANLVAVIASAMSVTLFIRSQFQELHVAVARIEAANVRQWRIEDQQNWSDAFRAANPAIAVPFVSEIVRHRVGAANAPATAPWAFLRPTYQPSICAMNP